MKSAMQAVKAFHEKCEQPIGSPAAPDVSVDQALRMRLIKEEVDELAMALDSLDKHGNELTPEQQIVDVADALGDIAYVVVGAAVTWGIPLAEVFDAIQASNMTKNATGKRGDGKIMKGPDYSPPDIAYALKQGAFPERVTLFNESGARCVSVHFDRYSKMQAWLPEDSDVRLGDMLAYQGIRYAVTQVRRDTRALHVGLVMLGSP